MFSFTLKVWRETFKSSLPVKRSDSRIAVLSEEGHEWAMQRALKVA